MTRIAVCTTNKGKLAELRRVLQIDIESISAELDEIQSIDTELVCRAKAAAAYRAVGRPVLVDDTGFELCALGGFPGALVAWVLATDDVGILDRMLPPGADRKAVAVTCLGFASERGVEVFVGRTSGTVLASPRGDQGFGYDPVFVPDGATRTFAEMDDAEKDRCSPRGIALKALGEYLNSGGS